MKSLVHEAAAADAASIFAGDVRLVNGPSANGVLAAGSVILSVMATYAARRLLRTARLRRPWHEITARALQLMAVSLILYSFGSDLVTGEASAPPVAVYVAMGLFALVVLYETVMYARKP